METKNRKYFLSEALVQSFVEWRQKKVTHEIRVLKNFEIFFGSISQILRKKIKRQRRNENCHRASCVGQKSHNQYKDAPTILFELITISPDEEFY